MSDADQWRYQWPDGTWIRWNAQTQSWEKEAPPEEGAAGPASSPAGGEVPAPVLDPQPVAPAPAEPPITEPEASALAFAEAEAIEPTASEGPAPASEEGLDDEERAPATLRPTRTSRPIARNVLPPPQEPERPGGSLWPTVLVGAVVGVGVGLVVSAVIR